MTSYFYPENPTIEEVEIVRWTIINMLVKLLDDSESGKDMAIVFLMSYLYDYQGDEVAKTLNTSPTRITNLKKKIRLKLSKFR